MSREQFTFYRSFWDSIKRIKNKTDRLSALEAVIAYALDGEERPMTDVAESLFCLMKPVLLAAQKKSEGRKAREEEAKITARQVQDTVKIPSRCEQDSGNKNKRENKGENKRERENKKESYIIPPSPLAGATPAKEAVKDVLTFDGKVGEAVCEWIKYKRERRQTYTPSGLDVLYKRIKESVDTYGEDAVCTLIRDCIASGYQGITFDRLTRSVPKTKPGRFTPEANERMRTPPDGELDRIKKEMAAYLHEGD